MAILNFVLPLKPVGVTLHSAGPDEPVHLATAQLALASEPSLVQTLLETFDGSVFSHITGFQDRRTIYSLLIIIEPNLNATAYVNDLHISLKGTSTRPVAVGETVYTSDLSTITELETDREVPEDCSVISDWALGWRRSIYFDFGPHQTSPRSRLQPFKEALLEVARSLFGYPSGLPPARNPFPCKNFFKRTPGCWAELTSVFNSTARWMTKTFQTLLHSGPETAASTS